MKKFLPFLFALVLVACPMDDCDPPTASDGGDNVTNNNPIITDDSQPAPERVDRKPNIHNMHIFTFFGATREYDETLGHMTAQNFEAQYVTQVIRYMMERGYNTGRVGAQTDGWWDNEAFYLVAGPEPFTPEWRAKLKGFLDLTARIPGFQLQLIPTFTHKGNPKGKKHLVELTKEVVKIVQAKNYKHVVWEAFNEFWHPSTRDGNNLNSGTLEAVMDALPHPRGTDFPDNGKEGDEWRGNPKDKIGRAAKNMMDYMAFHPSRNPEPTVNAYIQSMNSFGRAVVFDETVSWISITEQGMVNKNSALFTHGDEKEMRKQVTNQQHALCNAGATCSFHALWLFSYDHQISWAPQCPCN